MMTQILCPLLYWIIIIEFENFFLWPGYQFFIRYVLHNYFLPLCGLSFYYLNRMFWRMDIFNFIIKSNISVFYRFLVFDILLCFFLPCRMSYSSMCVCTNICVTGPSCQPGSGAHSSAHLVFTLHHIPLYGTYLVTADQTMTCIRHLWGVFGSSRAAFSAQHLKKCLCFPSGLWQKLPELGIWVVLLTSLSYSLELATSTSPVFLSFSKQRRHFSLFVSLLCKYHDLSRILKDDIKCMCIWHLNPSRCASLLPQTPSRKSMCNSEWQMCKSASPLLSLIHALSPGYLRGCLLVWLPN